MKINYLVFCTEDNNKTKEEKHEGDLILHIVKNDNNGSIINKDVRLFHPNLILLNCISSRLTLFFYKYNYKDYEDILKYIKVDLGNKTYTPLLSLFSLGNRLKLSDRTSLYTSVNGSDIEIGFVCNNTDMTSYEYVFVYEIVNTITKKSIILK